MSASPDPKWFEAVARRVSRRSYRHAPVDPEALAVVRELCAAFRPWPEARAELIEDAHPAIFLGIVGAYGGISGAPSALAFVGDVRHPERVGYTGQGLVLAATALGLDTCWVGGFFDVSAAARRVAVGPGERIFAVSPLGYATEAPTVKERLIYRVGRPKPRREMDAIAPGSAGWPAWARAAVEAARLAPSAVNRQPWRFRMEDGSVTVSFELPETAKIPKRLDCGIAMVHFELGALSHGVAGTWETLASPAVARFVTR